MVRSADHALERLYRHHRGELYRWLLRETGDPEVAEDVLQTAFLHAYRALLAGAPPREPRSWLFAIARNANRRRLRRRRVVESEYAEDLAPAGDDSGIYELKEALATLSANQRTALVLQVVGGFSYAEIADRLELTISSVQMLVFRARRRLRAQLLGERRIARAFLPVQALVNLLSRLSPAGDRAVLLRGAAGIAGAVALGSGILVTPGGGLPPVRGEAAARGEAAVHVARAPAPPVRRATSARRTAHAATIAGPTARLRSAGRRNTGATESSAAQASRVASAPPAAGPAPAPPSQPAARPIAKPPLTSALPTPPSVPAALPALPALPAAPQPPAVEAAQPPTVPAAPTLPPVPQLPPPAPPSPPPILATS